MYWSGAGLDAELTPGLDEALTAYNAMWSA